MATVTTVGPRLGIAPTCRALALPRATFYRQRRPRRAPPRRRPSPRALGAGERAAVLAVLHEPRFVDLAPAEVYATLLDAGRYLCSERTMYRILAENHEVRERRNQLRHPHYAAPELLARRPKELWSWDITKLLGLAKWTYFYLYVMLDVFSRYVVGWMVAHRESATLAERFIQETCGRRGIDRGQLTIHAERGSAMTSKPVALLLADLGVTKTHGRPHVSNDNPFSGGAVQDAQVPPSLLPLSLMQLQPGDRLTDATGEWEVMGRPYTTAGGKNAHVRLSGWASRAAWRFGTWGAHERVSVKRARATERGIRWYLGSASTLALKVDASGVWTVVNLAFTAAATREATMDPLIPPCLGSRPSIQEEARASGTFQTR
jgi:putative transposase